MPNSIPAHPGADRNLLFGILALQLDFINRDRLIGAMNAWVLDKHKPLGQILVEQQALGTDTCAALELLVDKHLEQHGQQPQRSLAALPVSPDLRRDLDGIPDAELHASLDTLSTAPPHRTPFQPAGAGTGTPESNGTAAVGEPTSSGLRFRVLRQHAEGGLGTVSLAHDRELNRDVALKEIKPDYAQDAMARARFLAEAEITGGLEHPGVVPVYGLGRFADGRPYYAMRFIQGDSLLQAIDRFHRTDWSKEEPGERELALRGLLRRFVDVCNVVGYAHSRGVLHRDIKPANVMLGPYGETLLVDWGLAKALKADEGLTAPPEGFLRPSSADGVATEAGAVVGTPAYMAPEQAAGRPAGPSADIYGLGATLYHLLTGQAPFGRGDALDILVRVAQGHYKPAREANPSVPRALSAVCQKAMALASTERYGAVHELAEEVERWLADEPVIAAPESWGQRAARWVRHHRTIVAAATIAVLLLLIGGGIGLFLWQTAEQRRQQQAHEYRFNLSSAAAADDGLALAELHASHFASALKILRQAVERLGDEPSLAELRQRLQTRRDRSERLAGFYRCSEEGERIAAEESSLDIYGPAAAESPCEEGLRKLGVFDHPNDWWTQLPDADLEPPQKSRLRDDAYHQLLLLAGLRAQAGLIQFGKPGAAPAFHSALDIMQLARRFQPKSYAGSRFEYILRLGLGQQKELPQVIAEPQDATDYYFSGILHLSMYQRFARMHNDLLAMILVQQVARPLNLDVKTPLETAERYLRMAAHLDPRHYWS